MFHFLGWGWSWQELMLWILACQMPPPPPEMEVCNISLLLETSGGQDCGYNFPTFIILSTLYPIQNVPLYVMKWKNNYVWVENFWTYKTLFHIKVIDFTLVSFQQSRWVIVLAVILLMAGHIHFSQYCVEKFLSSNTKCFDKSPAQNNHIKQTMQFGQGTFL